MRIEDFLEFNRESCFDGAVQSDWFYDETKAANVANSFVFHGPKYFGVAKADIGETEHQLIDTASFSRELGRRMADESNATNLIMTIAGYGTGKSHLSVTLAELFSGHDRAVQQSVLNNIQKVDNDEAAYLEKCCRKPNLVIVLNGMNNFNLDHEVLICAQSTLRQHGIPTTALYALNSAHKTAADFLEGTFQLVSKQYMDTANKQGIHMQEEVLLKNYLAKNLETDPSAFAIINTVYRMLNKTEIPWDRGISAGDILLYLSENLCGNGKTYGKVLVLFDEFGRYLEYVAANPAIAGESALQQIFETIQNSNGRVVFTGFIQSDLSTYKSRMEKTSNISRYIDRYSRSDKYYLSTNYETILANLLQKSDPVAFHTLVEHAIDTNYAAYLEKMTGRISRWNKSIVNRGVWMNELQFKQVIAKGCYPIHPMTVLILSGMSNWLQQRSTIAFVQEAFDRIKSKDVEIGKSLPYVYPYEIITSSIYGDMLDSEEKGLVNSQYCLQYRDLMTKIGDKLSMAEVQILQAILILNIGRFTFHDRAEANLAIELASGYSDERVVETIKSLEDMYGAITFDEHANQYDLNAEATGFNDFRRLVARHKQTLTNFCGIRDYDAEVANELSLDKPIETPFAQQHSISAGNWNYECKLFSLLDVKESNITTVINKLHRAHDGSTSRGCILYVYMTLHSRYYLPVAASLYQHMALDKENILLILLDDSDSVIVNAMRIREILKSFDIDERKRFEKYIADQDRMQLTKIRKCFDDLVKKRIMITNAGECSYEGNLRQLCLKKFKETYTATVPFVFDGFEKKLTGAIKTLYTDVIMSLLSRMITDEQWYSGQGVALKNRISAALYWDKTSENAKGSWQCLTSSCLLVEPNNPLVKQLYDEAVTGLSTDHATALNDIFSKYFNAPYGMDDYSLGLFVAYFIAMAGAQMLLYKNAKCDEEVRLDELRAALFPGSKDSALINIRALLSLYVQLKGENYRNPVEVVCEKVAKNRAPEECEKLGNELNRALANANEAEVSGTMVAAANKRISDGKTIYKSLYSKIDEATQIIEANSETFDLFKFLRVFVPVSKFVSEFTGNPSFDLSQEYLDKTSSLERKARRMLSTNFTYFIDHISCKITGLDRLKENATIAENTLNKINCTQMAVSLSTKVSEIETMLLAHQKYERIIAEITQQIVLVRNNEKMSYSEMSAEEEKLESLQTYLSGLADMPLNDKDKLLVDLSCTIHALQDRKDAVIVEVQKVRTMIQKFDEKQDVQMVLTAAEDVVFQNITAQFNREFSQYVSELTTYYNNFTTSPDSLASLARCKQFLSSTITTKSIVEAMKHRYQEQCDYINGLQERWLTMWENKSYSDFSSEELVKCQTALANVPAYLDDIGLERVAVMKSQISRCLAEKKIDGVISMFKQLSAEEREQCFDRLKIYK